MNLRKQIRAHLERTGTSQRAFAEKCGRTRDWLAKYLAGHRKGMLAETQDRVLKALAEKRPAG